MQSAPVPVISTEKLIGCLRMLSMEDRMTVILCALQEQPKNAIWSLYRVFQFGTVKWGAFDASKWTRQHFMDKFNRHINRANFGESIDESGEPHLIHAAADLLLAWECEQQEENNGNKNR
jgi:hypothetical protein